MCICLLMDQGLFSQYMELEILHSIQVDKPEGHSQTGKQRPRSGLRAALAMLRSG